MIKKAILPVVGLGTRFLSASKSLPKEMVSVVNRPAIEYVVREAVAAGIEQSILVTHSSKTSIENYFDRNFELETTLENKKKFDLLKEITVLLLDLWGENSDAENDLSMMIQSSNPSQASQIMVKAVPDHLVDQYGIVEVTASPLQAECIVM